MVDREPIQKNQPPREHQLIAIAKDIRIRLTESPVGSPSFVAFFDVFALNASLASTFEAFKEGDVEKVREEAAVVSRLSDTMKTRDDILEYKNAREEWERIYSEAIRTISGKVKLTNHQLPDVRGVVVASDMFSYAANNTYTRDVADREFHRRRLLQG